MTKTRDLADLGGGFIQAGTGAVQRTVESKLQDVVSVKDFGADPTGVVDSTTAIQNACNAAVEKLLRFEPNGTYRCSAQIHMKGDVDGQGSTLMFYGSVIPFLVYQNSMGNLRNFTINGANVTSCQVGLQVDTDFVFKNYCSYDIAVKNISNSNNTQPCTGAQFFKGSGSTNLKSLLDIRIQVTNVVATSNGVLGDNGGKATGILVGFNASLSDGNVVVHDCNVDTVSSGGANPYEDSDGIHLLIAGHESAAGRGLVQVRDCVVRNTKKRGYKIQAPNALVDNCICYGNDVLGGFETYAYNTTFSNCKYIAGTGTAFSATRSSAKFLGCYAEGSGATVDLVRVYTDADNTVFDSCEFKSTAAYATGDYGVMQIYEADDVRLCNTILSHNASLGCSLLLRNSAIVSIDGCIFKGSDSGINLWGSTGRVLLSDTQIFANNSCVSRAGNTSQALYASNCRFFTGGTSTVLALWNSGGANSAYAEISNCTIIANGAGGGAWVSAPSRVTGCRIEQQGAQAGIGIYFPGHACVARNNSISNFSDGISARYATNQEISDNVTINCVTPFDLTGSTPLVNTDNFSR